METKIHYLKLKDKRATSICDGALRKRDEITNDYHQITCKECKDILTLDIIKINVDKRTEAMHQILIKYYGGVREYLLSMGLFKDIKI